MQMSAQLKNGVLQVSDDLANAFALSENTLIITPVRDAKITLTVTNIISSQTEQTIIVNFLEPGASVEILGLYKTQGEQTLQIKTLMHHHVPRCESRQVWRGVLDHHSKVDFEGKIIVAKDAQKTSAHLSNKNLLLSDNAEIKTKPFLEIYADDVKCSHGATVGCLDANAIFYLRSRGVPENEARALLVEAFVAEIHAHASACATEAST